MKFVTSLHSTQKRMPTKSEEWHVLNKILLSYIKNCLYTYSVLHWIGGEQELAEDVLQETYLRAFRFAHNSEEHEDVPPINNFEALCKTIAKRYILDIRRKDKHFVGSLDNTAFSITHETISMSDDPAMIAIEDILLYTCMLSFSQAIKRFPKKQRIALLTDLARNADFDDECSRPLERAMWSVGIPLRDYYCELPHDPILRSQYKALVSIAYKRLRLAFNTTLSPFNAAA